MKLSALFRVCYRAPAALAVTFFYYDWIRLRQIFHCGGSGPHRSVDLVGRWGAAFARVMGIKIKKLNERQGPIGDLLVADHMGFLDVPVLLSVFPSLFLIKMEMRRVFFFGQALEKMGHVFVERGSSESRHSAREGISRILAAGERMIIFPEGRGWPEAERLPFKPFSFYEAQRQDKLVEGVVLDYLPDRSQLKWDVNRKMFPQLVELFGRRETEVSIEFLPARKISDGALAAQEFHDEIQGALLGYDAAKALPEGAANE